MNLIKTFLLTTTFFVISCGGQDDDVAFNPCLDRITPAEIKITDASIETVNNDTLSGYVVRALITNNSSETIEGRAWFYTIIEGVSTGFGSNLSCNTIEANMTCEVLSSHLEIGSELEYNLTVRCTYFELY